MANRIPEYPNEAFIENEVVKYFKKRGYRIYSDDEKKKNEFNKHADIIAENDKQIWVIEAKGKTSDPGVDFNTGLGQLAKKMVSGNRKYAIAIPQIEQYKKQCLKLPNYYRATNELNIFLVNDKGDVKVINPLEDINEFWF